jgi:hypothetical protein
MSIVVAQSQNRSYSFENLWTDRIANTVVVTQCPALRAEQIRFKNHPDSSGNAWVGSDNLTTDTGFPLAPGDDTGWIPINNLNKCWHVEEDATTYLQYMLVR